MNLYSSIVRKHLSTMENPNHELIQQAGPMFGAFKFHLTTDLRGVKLIVGDDHLCLKAARKLLFIGVH
jgi:hypothetical protein